MSLTKKTEGLNPISSFLNSTIPCDNKTCIAITTVVAMLAIGAVVVGVLAIIASLQNISGLGAISQIGWQAGAALTAFGVTTLITLIMITLVRYGHSAKKNEDPQSLVTPSTENRGEDASRTSFPQDVNRPSTQPEVAFSEPSLDKIVQTLNIANVEDRLRDNYGNNPISLPSPPADRTSASCKTYEETVTLILLTDEDLLSLPLDEITRFSPEGFSVVYHRLLPLESRNILPTAPELQRGLTLENLRSLNGEGVIYTSIPENCLGLLRAAQLEDIFTTNKHLILNFVQQLLPANDYTYQRLRMFDHKILEPHLNRMTIELFRLLPTECFELDTFPWSMVNSVEKCTALFSLQTSKATHFTDFDKEFTQKVFGKISIRALIILAPLLSCDHLPLVPKDKLKDKDFPWSEFVNKKGIEAFAPYLKLGHLLSFGSRLKEQGFPWLLFIKQDGAPSFLHKHFRAIGPEIYAFEFFPWLEFSKEELLVILPTKYHRNTSSNILNVIHENNLRTLFTSKRLDGNHWKLLKPDKQKRIPSPAMY
jgi:hypothetical protein